MDKKIEEKKDENVVDVLMSQPVPEPEQELDIDALNEHYGDKSVVFGNPEKYYEWHPKNDSKVRAELRVKGFQVCKDPSIKCGFANQNQDGEWENNEYYEHLILFETSKKTKEKLDEYEERKREMQSDNPVPEAAGQIKIKKKFKN